MRILVVEDEMDILEFLRSYFTDLGHTVLTAATVPEALQRLQEMDLDLALVDLLLPRGHGRTVIQALRRRAFPTRIVVVTGCDDLEVRRELLTYGLSDYLFKPVSIRDLEALLACSGGHPAPTRTDEGRAAAEGSASATQRGIVHDEEEHP